MGIFDCGSVLMGCVVGEYAPVGECLGEGVGVGVVDDGKCLQVECQTATVTEVRSRSPPAGARSLAGVVAQARGVFPEGVFEPARHGLW